jgi:hypothetical protein
MKFNWGMGIVLVLAVFLTGMITLVVISSSQELNLVTPDYYPKGIDYQTQIDKETRTNNLEKVIEFSQDNNSIYLSFPGIDSLEVASGKILLFYPRSYRFDKEYDISLNDTLTQIISKDSIMKGRCIIKVDWMVDSLDYYQEKELMLR